MTGLKLKDKIALITGASRGIGAAVAKRFAAEGAHVILTARTVGGLEEVDDAIKKAGGAATLVPLDIKDFDKIDQLGHQIFQRFGKLDILVGNAGTLGELAPLAHIPPNVWQNVMDVNVTANYRLIRSLDALLRAADAGRAMFVSSGVVGADMAYWGPYTTSKAALEAMVKIYAAETATTNLRVNLIDPGEVNTKMHSEAMPGADPNSYPSPESITDTFVNLALPSCEAHGEVVNV